MLLERRLFFMYFSLCFFCIYSLDKVFVAIVLDKFFFHLVAKKVVAGCVKIVTIDGYLLGRTQQWSFDRGGRLNRFGCNALS